MYLFHLNSNASIRSRANGRRFANSLAEPGEASKVHIKKLVDDISRLTLIETADLIAQLKVFPLWVVLRKTRLQIADIAMPAMSAGASPAAAPAAEAAPAAPKASSKAIFNVKLESFDAASKAKVIREVKTLLGCNLVEAKNTVEKAPTMLKENVAKDVICSFVLRLTLGREQAERDIGETRG
jgi:large subunit ribosomal protein L7/L12